MTPLHRDGPPMLLDTFHGRLRLVGVVTTQTALHIGAGGSGEPLGTDAPVVRTAGGAPYIPGSSLKGVLRSAAEALFRGGAPAEDAAGAAARRLWTCNPVAGIDDACVTHAAAKQIRERLAAEAKDRGQELDSRGVAEEVWAKSCTVCRLFGSLALASRVRFADLPVRGEAPLFELRNGVAIDRDKELAADKALYDFEAVPPETAFDLRVTVDNPTDPEVGLLLYLFSELDLGNLTLGGKTSRGLGQVRVRWEAIEETTLARDNPFASLLSSRDLLAPAADAGGGTGDGAGAAATAAPGGAAQLPATGDRETWQQLVALLRELPTVDKGLLGERAAKLRLSKKEINQKLALGLADKADRRAWDVALEQLAGSGFLLGVAGAYRLAEREGTTGGAAAGTGEDSPAGAAPRTRALQEVLDRYVGAMARVWEEAR